VPARFGRVAAEDSVADVIGAHDPNASPRRRSRSCFARSSASLVHLTPAFSAPEGFH